MGTLTWDAVLMGIVTVLVPIIGGIVSVSVVVAVLRTELRASREEVRFLRDRVSSLDSRLEEYNREVRHLSEGFIRLSVLIAPPLFTGGLRPASADVFANRKEGTQ